MSEILLAINSPARQIRTACILEAAARKPGNVHPGASFADLTFSDLVRSAELTASVLAKSGKLGVGAAVREAVRLTSAHVGTNSNLGVILLLAPLAAIPRDTRCADGIGAVLAGLTIRDAALVYEAIRLARPGGLGSVAEQDVSQPPGRSLVEAMSLAADRDLIARQYVNGFSDVLHLGTTTFRQWVDDRGHWETAVIGTQLSLMAAHADSLIARKCGLEIARQSQQHAQRALDQKWPDGESAEAALIEFDQWLRADGHRRNPGTTADLIAAALFTVIRDGDWRPPPSIEVAAGPLTFVPDARSSESVSLDSNT